MTGFYVPNASDDQAGHSAGFGSTIIIANKASCGTNQANADATARADKFVELSGDLGLSQ